jgi:hypothetical protein
MLWLGARSCANTGAPRLAYNRKHSEIATKKRRIDRDLSKFNPWSASYIYTGSTRIPKGLQNSIPGIPSFPNWQFWQSRRFWQSLFPPPRPFSLFYCKQSTYLQSTHGPRLGGPCVALGWRLGGPRVAQSQTQSQQAEGRNACQLPNTKNQVPRFLANCQLLAANCSVFKDLFPLTP